MTDLEIEASTPSDTELATIAGLAREQQRLEREVAEDTAALQRKQDSLRQIREVDLPEAMSSAGIETFTATGGVKVSISVVYRASIPKDKAEQAFAWLRKHGHADIIKHEVSVKFGRDQDAAAESLLTWVHAQRWSNQTPAEDKRSVHPMTLAAFAKEQAAVIPHDIFGIFVQRFAKIVGPKGEGI